MLENERLTAALLRRLVAQRLRAGTSALLSSNPLENNTTPKGGMRLRATNTRPFVAFIEFFHCLFFCEEAILWFSICFFFRKGFVAFRFRSTKTKRLLAIQRTRSRDGRATGEPGTLSGSNCGAAERFSSPPQPRVRPKRRVLGPQRRACIHERCICARRSCMGIA